MKKLLLTLAAGIVLCSCGSHDPQIAIVPYPNHLETGRGTSVSYSHRTHGETEPRFGLYVYPDFPFGVTGRVSNLELE